MTTESYLPSAHELLQKARDELLAGDARQASEKGRGPQCRCSRPLPKQLESRITAMPRWLRRRATFTDKPDRTASPCGFRSPKIST